MTDTGDEDLGVGGASHDQPVESQFAITSYTPTKPPKREFKPWHRPRKHYIRKHQWGAEIDWLLNARDGGTSSLRYLGLPGADLLDLRYIHERFTAGLGHPLLFLGFDESARPDSSAREALNVSLHEVRSLPGVDQRSDVLGDNFRRLGQDDSIATSRARQVGAFDVVNLDLCGHFGSDDVSLDDSLYNAIHSVCGLQNRHPRPWSLFLTSRVDRAQIEPSLLTRLLGNLRRLSTDCPDFAAAYETLLGAAAFDDEWAANCTGEQFFHCTATALSSWLLGLAQSMRCRFSISSVMGYQVFGGSSYLDMLSVVVRFEPALDIDRDTSGIASRAAVVPDRCEDARVIPQAMVGLVDVDKVLREDGELMSSIASESALLLQKARYDADAYMRWLGMP